MIVDCAIYEYGRRVAGDVALADALGAARSGGGFVWIGLHEPTAEEFESVTERFDLHHLAVEDAIKAHQRPKLERYDDTLFLVLKPARYVDSEEVIEVGQIMVFLGDHFVVTVRHGAARELGAVRGALEADPVRLQWGPTSVLYAIADRIVDDYATVLAGVGNDIDEIETAVFSGPSSAHAERIFKLKREVLDFHRAVDPLVAPLETLANGIKPIEPEAGHYFRDVHDHALRASEQLDTFDRLLDGALHANVAQVGMRQNEDMRKISAWVAIVVVPTLIAGIYGMNFEHMPELGWRFGYPFALGLMAGIALTLYVVFKRRDWL